ncbi:acetate/propionate family kinase [Prescottella sp. R16]|uniref:acetate/propionate family kinase n=1 Tax=Prescottella sp. R16 TaxID=3064529 RepID=UPI00272EDAC2|nr:acetate kinase [Prescottella sp. R16]
MSEPVVLVINSGSSSIKFQLVEPGSGRVDGSGLIERIGESSGHLVYHYDGGVIERDDVIEDHTAGLHAAEEVVAEAGRSLAERGVAVVGHRVVHGGPVFREPTLLDDAVVAELKRLSPLAPLHNPPNVAGIEVARRLLPDVPHVAVFDTAFFHTLPEAAATYAIDTAVAHANGVRRYGFHGTSHEYVGERAAAFLGRDLEETNQIVLHLGNGASVSAIRGGVAVDTSMGMTPLEGLVMGTRSGDLDAGVILHLIRNAGMTVDELDDLLNRHSGLLGMCGENDFRAVRAMIDDGDPAARLAYDVYVHRLRRYLGAYLVELGGADAIVFTGGVGEHSAILRRDALAGLGGLGIVVDPDRNESPDGSERRIGADGSAVEILVIPTDEELAIARKSIALV